jgi:STE24 endopeptidase
MFAAGVAGNVLSRRVEASADAYALRLTQDPRSFIGLDRRLVVRNVAEPDPPRLYHALFGTHPTPIDRIGFAVSFQRR